MSKMNVEFFRDDDGYARADLGKALITVAYFLEQDIQGVEESVDQILKMAREVETGKTPVSESTGNAHSLTLRPGMATIENEYDPSLPVCELSMDDFIEIMNGWKQFISQTSK